MYFCFCGVANFKQFKLGFDREFFIRTVTDEQARIYETATRAPTMFTPPLKKFTVRLALEFPIAPDAA